MTPERVFEFVGNLPYMRVSQARLFYDLILHQKLSRCLELGFLHGCSSAYIAGAIEDLGDGCLVTIDLEGARQREPNIEWVLARTGLRHLVTVYYGDYNWHLMKMLEGGMVESFDFCYIDGRHTWSSTGFAYCLVSRLLRKGAWIAFDDLHFIYQNSKLAERPWVKSMPEEERSTPQVLRVFEVLVQRDPWFGNFRRFGRFGFAQKTSTVWSQEECVSKNKEIIAAEAIDRARVDPDFRELLLHQPANALSVLGSDLVGDPGLRFEETDQRHLFFAKEEREEYTLYYLPSPCWKSRTTEDDLRAMLEG
jgi:predicted O-methyltransferase YrrM